MAEHIATNAPLRDLTNQTNNNNINVKLGDNGASGRVVMPAAKKNKRRASNGASNLQGSKKGSNGANNNNSENDDANCAIVVDGKSTSGAMHQTVQSNFSDTMSKPEFCTEYISDIFKFLRIKEEAPDMKIKPDFLDRHTDINKRMRGILLDWLYEVHYKFRLLPETLYLTINLLDRYLATTNVVTKKTLQLVGGTCLLIAAKCEEYRPPEVRDVTYIMDNAYSTSDVMEMEVTILNTLRFRLTYASHLQFMDFFARGLCDRESDMFYLGMFVLESCLMDVQYATYPASTLASCALHMAYHIMYPQQPLTQGIGTLSNFTKEQIHNMEASVWELIKLSRDKSLGKKYLKDRFREVIRYVADNNGNSNNSTNNASQPAAADHQM